MCDQCNIPFGWELVQLTREELDEMCDAADDGDIEQAQKIVEGAYARLFRSVD